MPLWTTSRRSRVPQRTSEHGAVLHQAGRAAAAIAFVAVTWTVAFADDPVAGWMPAEAIRSEFSGHSLAGIYPGGKSWSEDILADGTTDYREAGTRRPGQWWTTALEFCFSYPEPGVGGCFRITKVSANCYELYDYSSEFGRAEAPPTRKGSWNGLMWRTQAPHTCEDAPSS